MTADPNKSKLLIVEDDLGLQSQLRWHFDQYEVLLAGDREEALTLVRLHEPPVILQDLGLPPDDEGVTEGFQCIREIAALCPSAKIIVMTGNADYENAVRAIAMGAYDFYQKPVNADTLDMILQRAYHIYGLEEQNRRLQEQQQTSLGGIIACDPAMLRICRMIEKLAPSNVTCTLTGESGTGKEVLAKALHQLSPERSKNRLVAINCAAVPENLMESELFGYEKGAFTGANKRTIGKVETAQNGTLFLDEIGDMPIPLQAKLLRFLQERNIERVGGREEIPVDVRVVCATNKNLQDMVQEGTFREDLFYRICEMEIQIPPLRDRQGDKLLLARHFLKLYVGQNQSLVTGFNPEAVEAIEGYDWPGNIREMENRIKRATVMADEKLISPEDLGINSGQSMEINLRAVRQSAERAAILRALVLSENNVSATAKLLGVTRPTLYDLFKRYNIAVPGNSLQDG